MQAKDLKPGDLFRVLVNGEVREDFECAHRICLINSPEAGIRFGFPIPPASERYRGYWCYMGELVEVELLSREGEKES